MKKILLIITISLLCITAVRVAVGTLDPFDIEKALVYAGENFSDTTGIKTTLQKFSLLADEFGENKFDNINNSQGNKGGGLRSDNEWTLKNIGKKLQELLQEFLSDIITACKYIVVVIELIIQVLIMLVKDIGVICNIANYFVFGLSL